MSFCKEILEQCRNFRFVLPSLEVVSTNRADNTVAVDDNNVGHIWDAVRLTRW